MWVFDFSNCCDIISMAAYQVDWMIESLMKHSSHFDVFQVHIKCVDTCFRYKNVVLSLLKIIIIQVYKTYSYLYAGSYQFFNVPLYACTRKYEIP